MFKQECMWAWEQRWKKGGSCVPLKELNYLTVKSNEISGRNRLNPVRLCHVSPGGLGQGVQAGPLWSCQSLTVVTSVVLSLVSGNVIVYQFPKTKLHTVTDLFAMKPMIPQS